jgi:hypothetical protein
MSGLIRGKEAITPTITFAPRKAKQCALDAMRRSSCHGGPTLHYSAVLTHSLTAIRYELRIPCSVQPKLGVGRPPVEAFLTVSVPTRAAAATKSERSRAHTDRLHEGEEGDHETMKRRQLLPELP